MTRSDAGDPPVRAAATVIVVRSAADGGMEVLLVQRHGRSGFAADAWVFPGGVVDPADATLPPRCWAGIDPAGLIERFGTGRDRVLALHVAAVRETFEEAGLLLATHLDGSPVDLSDTRTREVRLALADRSDPADFGGWLAAQDLVLELGALELWGRWITPRTEPKRYDTYFFVARAPEGQIARHDAVETTGRCWLTPRAAIDRAAAGLLHLVYPTMKNLEELAGSATPDELMHRAAARPTIRTVEPHVVQGADGRPRILHPDDPEFPGRGDTGSRDRGAMSRGEG